MNSNDFYKEQYFFEISRKDQLANAITIPVGIVTIIGGAIASVATAIDFPFNKVEILEIILLSISGFSSIITIAYMARSYFNYPYEYIASTLNFMDYEKELRDYYKEEINTESIVKEKIEEHLKSEYAKCTHRNIINNEQKIHYIHRGNWGLIIAAISIIMAGIPHVIKSAIDVDQSYKVEIINGKNTGVRNMPTQKSEQEIKQKEEKNEPIAPPSRVIFEDTKPVPPPEKTNNKSTKGE